MSVKADIKVVVNRRLLCKGYIFGKIPTARKRQSAAVTICYRILGQRSENGCAVVCVVADSLFRLITSAANAVDMVGNHNITAGDNRSLIADKNYIVPVLCATLDNGAEVVKVYRHLGIVGKF